jgi:hypothetical protein
MIADLTREVTERTGKPPGPAALCIINEVAFLSASRKGDRVRAARAIGVLLAQLGLVAGSASAKPAEPAAAPLHGRLAALADRGAP